MWSAIGGQYGAGDQVVNFLARLKLSGLRDGSTIPRVHYTLQKYGDFWNFVAVFESPYSFGLMASPSGY